MFEGFLLIFRVEKHPDDDFFDVYYLSEAKNRAPVSTLSIRTPFEALFRPINSRRFQVVIGCMLKCSFMVLYVAQVVDTAEFYITACTGAS